MATAENAAGRSPRAGLKFWVPVLLLSGCPLAIVFGANAGISPLDPYILTRFLLGSVAAAVILLLVLRLVIPDPAGRCLWLGSVLLAFGLYVSCLKLARGLGATWHPASAFVATTYTIVAAVIATIAVRPWQRRTRDPIPMIIAAVMLVGVNLFLGVARMVASPASNWRPAADALISSVASSPPTPGVTERPDIFYIVLDAFGRPDLLRRYYGLDLDDFLAFLRSKGFYVADRAQSNYGQTFLSLASTLNLSYLDPVAAVLGPSSADHRPLEYLIRHNALMQMARHAGYRVVAIGSDTDTTQHIDDADVCICDRRGLDSIEQAAIAATPLGALPLDRWTIDAHRTKLLHAFDALGDPAFATGGTFVFAHIMAPHPPFAFGPGASHPRQSGLGLFLFNDGDQFNSSTEEYVSGYHDQVLFVVERLKALMSVLLSRPGPLPVIVLQGDHGPGSRLHWEDAAATDMAERMTIFAAYAFPGEGRPLYPTMTPINGARALADRYFGASLSFVKDESAFSTLTRPYDFVRVPALSEGNRPSAAR